MRIYLPSGSSKNLILQSSYTNLECFGAQSNSQSGIEEAKCSRCTQPEMCSSNFKLDTRGLMTFAFPSEIRNPVSLQLRHVASRTSRRSLIKLESRENQCVTSAPSKLRGIGRGSVYRERVSPRLSAPNSFECFGRASRNRNDFSCSWNHWNLEINLKFLFEKWDAAVRCNVLCRCTAVEINIEGLNLLFPRKLKYSTGATD